ncbi:c-type cytochrome biogenesis protein CcmF [Moraxella caviae]|uniref:C-type cytochrome biogenesis protein CcmF n=1 Tax=Moraxella caviae TaxID=34060 RepID=A0A1T0A5W8_9GAMM|nr:heme lyase CcmF/NrfE family subunit [Moraxella caviae]OOR91070.1 c-type cytochrome biogenesis protein CcmF [Moraxella caviae]STZ14234.1 Cytochrome c-type biogenesis protein CcmF [Moraxella caviae]VEW13170.1 Cytochrome c-type biogenesis protein CcmF [Moraxella caviae]
MLITELGYFALLLALVLAILQAVLPTLGVLRNQVQWQRLAPSLAVAQFLAMSVSFAALMYGFLYNDFSLVYVASHSNSLLPWYYKLSATWGGHEGSLLLWLTILAAWCFLVAVFSRGLPLDMRARVLAVLGGIQVMMLVMLIFTSSPFDRSLPNLPVDGADLNPLLQDPGLIFHPPMLYMGYVGLAVPFAFCMAALWAGRLDAVWTRWSRPWTVAAWGFLTLGIAIGSWWAYYELGWGGWWFWDPVENASLMPWLAATALLHSLAVTEKRGVFKAWSIMLAIFAFALSLLGTFLVRSGVITSVHSFAADPTRGIAILAILALVIGAGLLMFALRGWRLTVESSYQLKSRETVLVVNNIILLVATLVVFLGTLYPIIADAFALGQVSVGPPYFNALFVPATWVLLAFMGVGANLRYKFDSRPLAAMLGTALVSALVLGAAIAFAMSNLAENPSFDWGVVLTALLSAWVLAFIALDIKDKVRHAPSLMAGLKKLTPSYYGMQLAHIGVLVTALGVAGVSAMSVERDVAMTIGDSTHVQGYDFVLQDFDLVHGSNYDATRATVQVSKDERLVATLYPEKRNYVVSMMPMTEVGIRASLLNEVYVALGEPIIDEQGKMDQNTWAVRVYVKPMVRWLWLGSIIMALGGLIAMLDKRYRLAKTHKE